MNGLRMTVNFSMRVGSGTGPVTVDPVRCAVSTICAADWSMSLWSYALSRIRIRCFAITWPPSGGQRMNERERSECSFLLDHFRADTRADGLAALADRESEALLEGDRGDQGDREVGV